MSLPVTLGGGPVGQPGHKHVAIIGGGWAGIQLLQSLRERGVNGEIFDKNDEIGGTWHPSMCYHSLTLHAPRWLSSMEVGSAKFPFLINDPKLMCEKASAKEMWQYILSFANHCGLRPQIHTQCLVLEVHAINPDNGTFPSAELVVKNLASGQIQKHGPFDLVVFASFSCKPVTPNIDCGKFTGKMMHSKDVKREILDDILRRNLAVVVVGASKSGSDMISVFQETNYHNVVWLMRKPYWFVRYEKVSSKNYLDILRGVVVILCLVLALVVPAFSLFVLWTIGFVTLPTPGWIGLHFDPRKFHFGLMDRKQLSYTRRMKPVIGEPARISKEGLILRDGIVVPCDVVIWATGYHTGFNDLRFFQGRAACRCW